MYKYNYEHLCSIIACGHYDTKSNDKRKKNIMEVTTKGDEFICSHLLRMVVHMVLIHPKSVKFSCTMKNTCMSEYKCEIKK